MSDIFQNSELYRRLRSADHGVIIVLGTGQWGKTVTVHSMIESGCFPGRDVALVNYPKAFVKKHKYPANYRAVQWPEELTGILSVIHPSRDVVVIDDAIFLAASRDSQTKENKGLQKMMTIASHHELFFILTIQNSSMLDISMFQSQDVYMIHKHMDIVALQNERDQQKVTQTVANIFLERKMRKFRNKVNPKAWGYCSTTKEMINFEIPHWWHPEMSKPFHGVVPS